MNILPRLFKLLLWTLLVLAVAMLIALTPPAQTAYVQWRLSQYPDLHLTVGSVWGGFGRVMLQDLKVERPGAVLTIPSVEARMPVFGAVWSGRIALHQVVAKGWVLDFNNPPPPPPPDSGGAGENPTPTPTPTPDPSAAAPTTPASPPTLSQKLAGFFAGALGQKLPWEISADTIESEGDVLIPMHSGTDYARVHVILSGGGVSAAHDAAVTFDAKGTFAEDGTLDLTAHGRTIFSMDDQRMLRRIRVTAAISDRKGTIPEGLTLTADALAGNQAGSAHCVLDFTRGERHLALFDVRGDASKDQLDGTWKLDLMDAEVRGFGGETPIPRGVFLGNGEFETDGALAKIHARGHAMIASSNLGALVPLLPQASGLKVETDFDLTRTEGAMEVAALSVALSTTQPILTAKSLQTFRYDTKKRSITLPNTTGDWWDVSIVGLPLDWLAEAWGGPAVKGGDLTGEVIVAPKADGFIIHSAKPLSAKGVSFQRDDGTILARDLDLSTQLRAESLAKGAWQLSASTLSIASGGQNLVTGDLKWSTAVDANHPATIAGSWKADIDGMSTQPGLTALTALAAKSASGDLSIRLGRPAAVESNFTLVQKEANHSINVNLSVGFGHDGTLYIHAPMKLQLGADTAQLSVEGSLTETSHGRRTDLTLSAKEIELERLRQIGPTLAKLIGLPLPDELVGGATAPVVESGIHDAIPFWHDFVGRIYVAFDKLKMGSSELLDVRGNLNFDRNSIRLEAVQYQLPDHQLAGAKGSISFDASAAVPYRLTFSLDNNEVDGAKFFPEPKGEEDPPFHGKFTVASGVSGSGVNLRDLMAHTEQEIHLKSKIGILRLLKVHLVGVRQDSESKVGDAAGAVGGALGKLAGLKPHTFSGSVHLNKITESVLNFSYDVAEIGYNDLTISAKRGLDGTIRVTELSMVSPEVRVTGTGVISPVAGKSFQAEPLAMEMKIGVKGHEAEILAGTELLSADKDDQGYTLFKRPIRFGGTLVQLDSADWYDVLFKAAMAPSTAKEEPPKKK